MPAHQCSLTQAVKELRNALNARADTAGSDWQKQVARSLALIEESARRHRDRLKDNQGSIVDVDTALNPSPVVARRTDDLRRELDDLLNQAHALRDRARTLHPVATEVNPTTAAGALSVAPETADVADFGVFCERIEQLLQGFEHFDEEEADLIQESVTLDLGAGD